MGCVCTVGYRGEFCEHDGPQRSHAPTVLAILFLAILLMAAAFILIKRCRRTELLLFGSELKAKL